MYVKVKNANKEVLSKKSPDGRYMIDIIDNKETYNGVRVCKVQLVNILNRDKKILDFTDVLYSRRKDLYWGTCSLLFFFYSFYKPSLKEFLVVCNIGNGKYAKLDVSKVFGMLTGVFPVLRKSLAVSIIKSNLSSLKWIDYN